MTFVKYLTAIAVSTILLASCLPGFLLPNHTRGFDIYQHPVATGAHAASLKENGIYISGNGLADFYLYRNGKIRVPGMGFIRSTSLQITPEEVMQAEQRKARFLKRNYWGEYEIRDSIIRFQFFDINTQQWSKRWVYEAEGTILNDSTIYIYYSKDRRKDAPTAAQCTLHFYPFALKPDSSRAWYHKRHWYTRNLDGSRR